MWDLPGPTLEPVFPALAGGFLTTAPPGKSLLSHFWVSSTGSHWFIWRRSVVHEPVYLRCTWGQHQGVSDRDKNISVEFPMGQTEHSDSEYKVRRVKVIYHWKNKTNQKPKPAHPAKQVGAEAWEQMRSLRPFREGLWPKRRRGPGNPTSRGWAKEDGGGGTLTSSPYIPRVDIQWEVNRCSMTGFICILCSVEYKKERKSMWGNMCTNKNNNTKTKCTFIFQIFELSM